jgi:hypothetical protein
VGIFVHDNYILEYACDSLSMRNLFNPSTPRSSVSISVSEVDLVDQETVPAKSHLNDEAGTRGSVRIYAILPPKVDQGCNALFTAHRQTSDFPCSCVVVVDPSDPASNTQDSKALHLPPIICASQLLFRLNTVSQQGHFT